MFVLPFQESHSVQRAANMTWMEEVSYQYRENEYFFVDVPAIFQFCLPALFVDFLRLCFLQICTNAVYQLITTGAVLASE